MPLDYQKNMREAELLCRECILKVIRDSMPIEQILRAYMDETIHDEIIEETLEKQVTEDEAIDMLEEAKKNNENSDKDIEINKVEAPDKDHEVTPLIIDEILFPSTQITNVEGSNEFTIINWDQLHIELRKKYAKLGGKLISEYL